MTNASKVAKLISRLLLDADALAGFEADEISDWIAAAGAWLRKRAAKGADLDAEYVRVVAMFRAKAAT